MPARAPAHDVHTNAVMRRAVAAIADGIGTCIGSSCRETRRVHKTSAFVDTHPRAGISRPGCIARWHSAFAVAVGDDGPRGTPSLRRRVLTPKKTVIRFRHNNTWPQKRVSATRTTTRDTTQSSRRMVGKVDSGVVSPAKTRRHASMQPAARCAAGFFVSSSTGSGTTRPARRRLTVGPIPAVRFVLGSSTCKSH